MSKKILIVGAPKVHPIIPPLNMAHIPFIVTPKKDPVLDTPDKVHAFLEECECDKINGQNYEFSLLLPLQ